MVGVGLVLALFFEWPAAAALQEDPAAAAQRHYDRGREFFGQGLYEEAIEELEAAEKLNATPIVAYDLATAYEKIDLCQAAIGAYQRYLRQGPNAEKRAQAEQRIAQQRARLAHNECKDRPAKAPVASGGPGRPAEGERSGEPQAEVADHHAWAFGARLGLVFGRIGSAQELTGVEGYTPIEKVGGFNLRVGFQLPLVRAQDKRPLLQAELFFALAYYGFNSVVLVDTSNQPLARVDGGSAKLPVVGAALRASIGLSPKLALVPSVGGGLGFQMISMSTDHCQLSSSLASPVLAFDLPLRYEPEPQHGFYFTPASLYLIFPPSSDGDPVDAGCFGVTGGGQATPKSLYGLDSAKLNYAVDVGYMYQF